MEDSLINGSNNACNGRLALPYTATLPSNYMTKHIQASSVEPRVNSWFNQRRKTREEMITLYSLVAFTVVHLTFIIISPTRWDSPPPDLSSMLLPPGFSSPFLPPYWVLDGEKCTGVNKNRQVNHLTEFMGNTMRA